MEPQNGDLSQTDLRNGEPTGRRLHRSQKNKMIFGVAGGLAEYFNVDPAIIRIVFIGLAFLNGIGVLLYLGSALLLPKIEGESLQPLKTVKDNLRSLPRETSEAGKRVTAILRGKVPGEGT